MLSESILPQQATATLQSGALPYRIGGDGGISVLLVSTGHPGRWSIPKGTAEPCFRLDENAAHEAYEEAGITGQIAPNASGKYRATKRVGVTKILVEVWVYLMQVEEVLETWPEEAKRTRRWFRAEDAAQLVGEPTLQRLCLELAASYSDKITIR